MNFTEGMHYWGCVYLHPHSSAWGLVQSRWRVRFNQIWSQQSYDAEERQGKQRSACDWPRKLSKEQKGTWRDGQHHNGRRCTELQIPLDQRLLELWYKREWARRIRYDGQQVWHLKFRLWRGHRHRWQHSFAKILPSPWKLGSLEREVQKLRDGVLEGSSMLTLKSKYKNNF